MSDSEPEIAEDDQLQSFLGTTSFGKQKREANVKRQIELSKRSSGPHRTLQQGSTTKEDGKTKDKTPKSDDDSDDEDDDDDDDDDEDEYPVSHEMILKTHQRAVTSITLDNSGGRMVTGSTDCTLKFHDFASMTPTTIRAFKSVDPTEQKNSENSETHPIHRAQFNPNSANHILVATALPQARVISRDGETLCEFVKGDMYLRDMHNTKGHISEVTTAAWNPVDRNVCVTASTDSTLRIWDINNPRSQREVIVHKCKAAGSAGRTRMTAVAWGSPMQGGNNILVSAAYDGSLIMWSGDGPHTRPAAEIRDAHEANTWTSGLDISADGRLVVTRGGDNTIKTWDTRKFKLPIATVAHPSTSAQYSTTNITFSPNSAYIVTGSETGHLHILNPATLRPEHVTPVTPGSALIVVEWHARLNQILTGSANAETHVLYNPETSMGGAKDVMSRAPKRRHLDDDPNFTTDIAEGVSGDTFETGGARSGTTYGSRHPTIGLTASGKSRDPRRPHQPVQTPFARNNPDEEYVRTQIPLSSLREEDPREALLKYAEKAESDPLFTNAWKTTQPKTIYAELSDDDEQDAPDRKKQKQ
ncbi:hypothetical protein AMS68_003869 [Peltaster fructicola]|uniref:Anaphase-promoting complex subunit 4 WD40 domain-containing protein n=1 Tax=Peltaster fructicola TaxID=286661 RepID=A0A6H0XUB4_9PEZI|nr:hypothetical protein AMS68_003869 [Peltaster fructicola]